MKSTARALSELAGEWAAVAASLGRLTAEATAEATASAICAELARLPDLDGVVLLAFGAAGTTIPLGVAMPGDVGLAVNVALPDGRSDRRRLDHPGVNPGDPVGGPAPASG